ncbi:MAG: cupin domain-containing protein, partial [Chloroflexi bacterium]|nr:cupin domain-containing protein [Chloroflexota bacterium]
SEKLIAEIVCYEPGQHTVQHLHPRQDEIFYIVEGEGIITVDGEEITVRPTSVVFVPAKTKHGIKTTDDSRLLLMFIKGPGSASAAG